VAKCLANTGHSIFKFLLRNKQAFLSSRSGHTNYESFRRCQVPNILKDCNDTFMRCEFPDVLKDRSDTVL
jgi:hypothetical protein